MKLTSFIPMPGSKLTAMTVPSDTPVRDHTGKEIGRVESVAFVDGGISVTVEITDEEAQGLVSWLPNDAVSIAEEG